MVDTPKETRNHCTVALFAVFGVISVLMLAERLRYIPPATIMALKVLLVSHRRPGVGDGSAFETDDKQLYTN